VHDQHAETEAIEAKESLHEMQDAVVEEKLPRVQTGCWLA
jgi:hypothetical protein